MATAFDLSGMSSARAMEASRDTNCCTKCDETERFLVVLPYSCTEQL